MNTCTLMDQAFKEDPTTHDPVSTQSSQAVDGGYERRISGLQDIHSSARTAGPSAPSGLPEAGRVRGSPTHRSKPTQGAAAPIQGGRQGPRDRHTLGPNCRIHLGLMHATSTPLSLLCSMRASICRILMRCWGHLYEQHAHGAPMAGKRDARGTSAHPRPGSLGAPILLDISFPRVIPEQPHALQDCAISHLALNSAAPLMWLQLKRFHCRSSHPKRPAEP